MKRYLAVAFVALAAAGCTTAQSVLQDLSGPTSAPVANTAEAAGDLAAAVIPIADAAVKSAACSRACRDAIAAASHLVRRDMDAVLDAEAGGTSAAMALALQSFNTDYATLWTALKGGGATLP